MINYLLSFRILNTFKGISPQKKSLYLTFIYIRVVDLFDLQKRFLFSIFLVFALVSVKSQYDVSIAIPVRFKQVELKLKGKNWSKGDVNDIVLGSVLLNRVAQYDSAYNWMLKAIDERVYETDLKAKAICFIEFANVQKYRGRYEVALSYYLRADSLIKRIGETDLKARYLVALGEFYRKLGRLEEARSVMNTAINFAKEGRIKDTALLISVYNRMAAVQNEGGGDSVVAYSLKAIALSRKMNDPYLEAISFNEIGFVYKNMNLVDTSLKCYLKAEKLWMRSGSLSEAVHAMYNRALLMSHNYKFGKESIGLYKKIIELCKENKIDYPIENVYMALSSDYYFLGDSASSYRNKVNALNLMVTTAQKRYANDIGIAKEKYENDRIQSELKQSNLELKQTEEMLFLKKKESKLVYLFLIVLSSLLAIIFVLYYKNYKFSKQLQKKVKEKEALVQEIHHRVKNNLQFVTSLINLQINSASDSETIPSLHEAGRRIKAMSLVHEMLYNNDDVGALRIDQYLKELVHSMNELLNTEEIPVVFKLECDAIYFSATTSTALGMITSELIANSIKHAFRNTEEPIVKIQLNLMENGRITFSYSDNGNGVKESKSEVKNLGMRLVDIFSRQLKGTYTINGMNGFSFILDFVNG